LSGNLEDTAMAMGKKGRADVAAELTAEFAAEFAEWRLGGCPGTGWAKSFKVRVERVARRHGQSYSELWAQVHRAAYEIIDRDERSRLATETSR
jgi:hypothetical protein